MSSRDILMSANDTYFIATYGSGNPDLWQIGFDNSGSSYLYGTISGTHFSKFTPDGSLVFQKFQSSSSGISVGASITDSNGNTTLFAKLSNFNLLITKTDYTGAVTFRQAYSPFGGNGTSGTNTPQYTSNFGTMDSAGNLYACGPAITVTSGTGVCKINSAGTFVFQKNMKGAYGYSGAGVAVDSSGNVFAIGLEYITASNTRPVLVKYNSSGVLQWQIYLSLSDTTTNCTFNSIITDSSGNIYVGGTDLTNPLLYKGFLVKFDTSGAILWQRDIEASSAISTNYRIQSICFGQDGYIYCTSGLAIARVLKFDTSGNLIFQRKLTGGMISSASTDGFFNGVKVDSEGSMYLVGNFDPTFIGVGMNAKLPSDGSKTGTYTKTGSFGVSYTYANGDLTVSTSTYIVASTSLTITDVAMTPFTPTITDSTNTDANTLVFL